jgi:hypothetical protein
VNINPAGVGRTLNIFHAVTDIQPRKNSEKIKNPESRVSDQGWQECTPSGPNTLHRHPNKKAPWKKRGRG